MGQGKKPTSQFYAGIAVSDSGGRAKPGSQGPQPPLDEGRHLRIVFISIVAPEILKRTPESTDWTICLQPRFHSGNVCIIKAHATVKIPKGSQMTVDDFIHT